MERDGLEMREVTGFRQDSSLPDIAQYSLYLYTLLEFTYFPVFGTDYVTAFLDTAVVPDESAAADDSDVVMAAEPVADAIMESVDDDYEDDIPDLVYL